MKEKASFIFMDCHSFDICHFIFVILMMIMFDDLGLFINQEISATIILKSYVSLSEKASFISMG